MLRFPRLLFHGASLLVTLGVVSALGLLGPVAGGATDSTVVSAAVVTSISLDVTECEEGSASLSFGVVPAGTTSFTDDCTIRFGGGDGVVLALSQRDGVGAAMHGLTNGAVDTAFGAAGRRDLHPTDEPLVEPRGVTVTADGSSLLVHHRQNPSTEESMLTRLDRDGEVLASFPLGSDDDLFFHAVEDDQGRIVAAGIVDDGATLRRFHPDGTPDASYGVLGTATFAPETMLAGGGSFNSAFTHLIQDGDDLIATGVAANAASSSYDCFVARIDDQGQLVTSWGEDDGVTRVSAPLPNICKLAALGPSGDVFVSGYDNQDRTLMHFLPDGTLDDAFGSGGIVRPLQSASNPAMDVAPGVAVQADGKPVIATLALVGGAPQAHLVRFTLDGTPDASFSSDGIATFHEGAMSLATSVLAEPGGSLLATVTSSVDGVAFSSRAVRFTSSGDVDGASTSGVHVEDFFATHSSSSLDGRVLLLGRKSSNTRSAAVALAAETIDQWGSSDWTNGRNVFAACLQELDEGALEDPMATWPEAGPGNCTEDEPASWRAVTPPGAGATVAHVDSGVGAATIRFGLRAATDQAVGRYVAPLLLEVYAVT